MYRGLNLLIFFKKYQTIEKKTKTSYLNCLMFILKVYVIQHITNEQ